MSVWAAETKVLPVSFQRCIFKQAYSDDGGIRAYLHAWVQVNMSCHVNHWFKMTYYMGDHFIWSSPNTYSTAYCQVIDCESPGNFERIWGGPAWGGPAPGFTPLDFSWHTVRRSRVA